PTTSIAIIRPSGDSWTARSVPSRSLTVRPSPADIAPPSDTADAACAGAAVPMLVPATVAAPATPARRSRLLIPVMVTPFRSDTGCRPTAGIHNTHAPHRQMRSDHVTLSAEWLGPER